MPLPTKVQLTSGALALIMTVGTLGCVMREQTRLVEVSQHPKKVTTVDIKQPQNKFGFKEALEPGLAPAPPPPATAPMMSPVSPGMRVAPMVSNDYPAMQENRERYDGKAVSPIHLAAKDPVSTFSIDVDTGAYSNARRFVRMGQLPPQDAVRTEELINYFRYDYPLPTSRDAPFSVTTDLAATPWNPQTRLLRIGLRGYDLAAASRPPANLVFLIDVSGSMDEPDKLPLVKTTLSTLAEQLGPRDRVSIVVYAGAAGVVLDPTASKVAVRSALDRLQAGGSTAGGEGIDLAYAMARKNYVQGGVNRVILATDGDFNVGITDTKALIGKIERERDSGITLTTLGFGDGNYNEAMMEQIADHGNGNYAYIDSAMEAKKVLAEEMASTLFTIAKDVKIQVEFNPRQIAQYRLIGYENRALREEDFDNDLVDAGEIGAGHQVTALYEVVPVGAKGWVRPHRYDDVKTATGPGGSELAYVKLRYKLPQGGASRLIERPIAAAGLQRAGAPRGDMAFAVAVAAYGQKLRGDALLGDFGWGRIATLAGPQQSPWRREFVELVGLAGSLRQS